MFPLIRKKLSSSITCVYFCIIIVGMFCMNMKCMWKWKTLICLHHLALNFHYVPLLCKCLPSFISFTFWRPRAVQVWSPATVYSRKTWKIKIYGVIKFHSNFCVSLRHVCNHTEHVLKQQCPYICLPICMHETIWESQSEF